MIFGSCGGGGCRCCRGENVIGGNIGNAGDDGNGGLCC